MATHCANGFHAIVIPDLLASEAEEYGIAPREELWAECVCPACGRLYYTPSSTTVEEYMQWDMGFERMFDDMLCQDCYREANRHFGADAVQAFDMEDEHRIIVHSLIEVRFKISLTGSSH